MVDQTDDAADPVDADSDVDGEDAPLDGIDDPAGDVDPTFDGEPVDSAGSDKNPIISALLSLVYPGLGHLYGNGLTARAVIFAVSALISYALILIGLGLFTTPVLVLVAALDAYNQTNKQ